MQIVGGYLQAHSKHLQQHTQQPPYPPHLLGLSTLPAPRSPKQVAAPLQEDAPTSSQEQFAGLPGSKQEAAQGAAHSSDSLPGHASALTQDPTTAVAESTQHAVQGTEQRALDSSSSAAGAIHATVVQPAAAATAVEARLAGGAQLSDSGATVTEHSPDANQASSTVAASTQGVGGAGNSRRTRAAQAQVNDSPAGVGITVPGQQQSTENSAAIGTTAPGQQQSKDDGQQEAGAHTGSPSQGCSSPQPPDESRADAWRPTAEGPLQSITEVACMHLVSDFIEDIGQVAMAAVLLCLLHGDTLFADYELSPALSL